VNNYWEKALINAVKINTERFVVSRYKIYFAITFLLLSISSLNADILEKLFSSYRNHIDVHGTFKDGAYTPPDEDFKFIVPHLVEPGYKINDFINPKDDSQGYVTFLDDIGQLFRIDFWDNRLNKTQTQRLEELDEEALKTFNAYMKNVQIIKKEKLSDDVYFVFYDFPKGSSVLVNNNRINATRGVLLFAKENKIVVLSQQFLESRTDYKNYEIAKKNLLSLKQNNFQFLSNVKDDIQDAKEQLAVGYKYLETKKFTKAKYWILRSAIQNNVQAQWLLGLMLAKGDGGPIDYPNAKIWFERASKQGSIDATYDLAAMYNNGEGVELSRTKAKELFSLCADAGHKGAITELIKIAQKESNSDEEKYWKDRLSKL
jgi:hypothetical protein